jgi:hypothetical protein
MAVTVTLDFPKPERISKDSRIAVLSGTIAFDSSYPTGGEAITGITGKFKSCLQILFDNYGGYLFSFDKTNSKLKAFAPVNVVAGSGTAATNNYVFKSATATLEVDGTGTAFQVAGAEVLDTTDLSGLTAVRFFAIGLLAGG